MIASLRPTLTANEGLVEKEVIFVDGVDTGFIKTVWVKKEDEDEEVGISEEEKKKMELESINNSIELERKRALANKITIAIVNRFNEVREFTPLLLREIAKITIDSSYQDEIEKMCKLIHLPKTDDDDFSIDEFILECENPALLKDIILASTLVNIHILYIDTLKEIAVEEYDIDVKKITKEVNKEFPLAKEIAVEKNE